MKHFSVYILTFALMAPIALSGQNESFESTVSEILANNPTLAARKANVDADILGLKADNNLADPEVEFEHQWGQPGVGNKWSVSVVQSFDWPGVYRSRAKASAAGAQAQRLLYLAEEYDMRLRVSNVLADYIAACMQLNLCQTISDNLSVIAEKIETAFNHGESTILDYRKIGFEKIEAATATDAAASLVVSLRQELITLNGGKNVNLDHLMSFPQLQLKTADFYIQTQMASDPAVLAGEYLSEAAVQNVKAASRANLPGFSLGYIHNVEIGDHFNGIKVGLTLPFFANRHRRSEAKARLQSIKNDLFATELSVTQRIISDYSKAALLNARIEQYGSLFPDSGDDYLDLLRKSFDGGQMSLVIYLYEVNYYTKARAEYINLLHDRTQALLSLSRTIASN